MTTESGLSIVLVGHDGAVWDLADHTSPVALLAEAVEGFHIEEMTPQAVTAARVAGQRRSGRTVKPRTITMSLRVGDQEPPFRVGDEWRDLDATFWRSLGVGQPCVLWVGDRSIQVSLDASTAAATRDPAIRGKGVYSAEFTADWPYFTGDEVAFTFDLSPTTGTNFFGGGAGTKGPPFSIGAAKAADSAAVANRGDVDAWPRWTLIGPGTFTVGVGSSLVTIPFALGANEVVMINTDPTKQTIVNAAGLNMWPNMGAAPVRFAAVPPGDSQPIVVQVTGAASGTMVGAAITPQFSRAW